MIDLDYFIEGSTNDIFERKLADARRRLSFLAYPTSLRPFPDSTVRSNKSLPYARKHFTDSLMSLILVSPEHHFSLKELRKNYSIMLQYLFLWLPKNPLTVDEKLMGPLLVKVCHQLPHICFQLILSFARVRRLPWIAL